MATIDEILKAARDKDNSTKAATQMQVKPAGQLPMNTKPSGQLPVNKPAPKPIPRAYNPRLNTMQMLNKKVSTEQLQKDINSPVGKFAVGFAQGAAPVNLKNYIRKDMDTSQVFNSAAYKVGEIAGIGAQFAIPYAGAAGAVGKAVTSIPKIAAMGKLGQGIAKSVATDIAVGLPLNANYAFNKEGLKGAEAAKSIAANTAIDLVVGGILEAVPVILKSGKKVASKAEFDQLGLNERAEVLQQVNQYNGRNRKLAIQSTDTDYRGSHEAPVDDGYNAPAYELTRLYPEDVYSPKGATVYGHRIPADKKAAKILLDIRNNPEAEVTIYRAVPKDAPETINRGDWVTITEDYAKTHGEHSLDDDYKIIESKVKAKHLFTNADSIHEFGYDGPVPRKTYRVEQTPLPRMSVNPAKQELPYVFASGNTYVIPKGEDIKKYTTSEPGRVSLEQDQLGRIDPKDYREFAKRFAEKNYLTKFDDKGNIVKANPITIKSDGKQVYITSKGINDVSEKIRGGEKSKSYLDSLLVLDKIIENVVRTNDLPNLKGRENPYTYYQGIFKSGAESYKVKVSIKDTPGVSRYQYHNLESIQEAKIEIEPTLDEPYTSGLSPENDGALIERGSIDSIPQYAEINNQEIPMQPSGPYTRDTFNAEFDEKFEKSYKAGMEETSAYGEPAGDGVDPTIAQSISGKGVIRGKDITRNADAAFRNNAEGRAWFRKAFEDNFYRSKGDYARSVKGELDGLFNNVVKDLGIRKGSKESAAVQWLGEGQRQRTMNGAVVSKETVPYDLQKLKEDFDYTMPNGKKAWENIVAAEGIIRKTYDDYVDRVNGALKKIYPNVEREVEKIMRKATKAPIKVGEIIKTRTRGNFGEIVEIDGDSITVYFKNNRTGKEATVTLPRSEIIPEAIVKEIETATVGKRLTKRQDYFRHFQEQQKGLFVGLDNIINGATAIDPNLVGLSEFTKPKSRWTAFLQRRKDGDVYVEDAVGGLLEYIPQAEYKINIEPNIPVVRNIIKGLKDSTTKTRNANQFIDELLQFTNDLAGKTNSWDRVAATLLGDERGRKTLNTLSLLSNRMRANAVVGNLNTVLAQFFNLPNVVGYAKNPVDLIDGYRKSIQAGLGNKEAQALLDKSMFLKERYLDRSFRRFDTGMLNNTNRFMSWMMELGDKAVADGAWMTFYRQAKKQNMDEGAAILFADEYTRRAVAGRGIGEMPLSQKAKVTKLFAPFQVEVRNAVNVLSDLGHSKDIAGIIGIFATTFLMNEMLEKTTGRRIGLDPADVIRDAIATGMEENQDAGTVAKGAAFGLAGNVVTNMPGGSYAADMGANYLGLNDYQMKELFGQNDPSRFGTGNIALQTLAAPVGQAIKGQDIDLLKPAASLIPPFGGRQIERTVRGLQDMAVLPREQINLEKGIGVSKQEFPASYSQADRLRFAMEPSPGNYLTAATLGTWATPEGKNYINNELEPLGDKQTPDMEAIVRMGVEPKLAETMVRGLAGRKLKDEKVKYVKLFNIDQKTKDKIIRQILDADPDGMTRDQRIKYIGSIQHTGISEEQYMKTLKLVSGIEGDGTYLSASKKKKAMIDKLNEKLTQKQKETLYDAFGVSEKIW